IVSLVDSPDVTEAEGAVAPAVKELHLVATLQVDPRVRTAREHDVDVQIEVAVLPGSEEMTVRIALRNVHQDAGAFGRTNVPVNFGISDRSACEVPVGRGICKSAQIIQGDFG